MYNYYKYKEEMVHILFSTLASEKVNYDWTVAEGNHIVYLFFSLSGNTYKLIVLKSFDPLLETMKGSTA